MHMVVCEPAIAPCACLELACLLPQLGLHRLGEVLFGVLGRKIPFLTTVGEEVTEIVAVASSKNVFYAYPLIIYSINIASWSLKYVRKETHCTQVDVPVPKLSRDGYHWWNAFHLTVHATSSTARNVYRRLPPTVGV